MQPLQIVSVVALGLGVGVPLARVSWLTLPALFKALVEAVKYLRTKGDLDDYLMAATAVGWLLMLAVAAIATVRAW